jgi:hypothetical protein
MYLHLENIKSGHERIDLSGFNINTIIRKTFQQIAYL